MRTGKLKALSRPRDHAPSQWTRPTQSVRRDSEAVPVSCQRMRGGFIQQLQKNRNPRNKEHTTSSRHHGYVQALVEYLSGAKVTVRGKEGRSAEGSSSMERNSPGFDDDRDHG